jgi:hypothetical protein
LESSGDGDGNIWHMTKHSAVALYNLAAAAPTD